MRHGTRSRYVMGCRCRECSAVEMSYQRGRYRHLKVSSELTRQHILWLKSYGLGCNSIADSCGVGAATVRLIRMRRKPKIYARTERRILGVTPEGMADGVLVDGAVTRILIRELIAEGWSGRELARLMGYRRTGLSMLYSKQVTAASALRVERLYRHALRGGSAALNAMRGKAAA